MKEKLYIGTLAALIWVGMIIAKHFWPDLDTGAIIIACAGVLTGLGVYHINSPDHGQLVTGPLGTLADNTVSSVTRATSAAAGDTAPATSVAGFASIRLLAMIASLALGLSMLAGCAGFQQALTGYEGAALKGIQASNDNTIAVWKVAACGTPLSAALRNPDIIPALKALCLPGGNASNPSDLLDAGKTPITINLTVPAAAASAAK